MYNVNYFHSFLHTILRTSTIDEVFIALPTNENEKIHLTIKNLETDVQNAKNQIGEKSEEIKMLLVEKFNMSKENKLIESEFESVKNEVALLRQKILQREKENENLLRNEHEKEKKLREENQAVKNAWEQYQVVKSLAQKETV